MLPGSSRCPLFTLWPVLCHFRDSWSYFRCCLSRVSRNMASCAWSVNAITSTISAFVSFVRRFVSSASFSSCNLFTVKWHWDIQLFSSFFSAFLRIVAAFTLFTVDLSVWFFGESLSWKQRVLKWRWFFQPSNFLVTFSRGDNPRQWNELAQDENKRRHKHTQGDHHHHPAVSREATKTASITWLLLSIYLSAVRVMSLSRSLCLSALGFSWWYLWTGDEGALSFCDQKTVGSREPALVACLVTSSWGVQSTGDSFWSEDLP